jgi:hypothetical protein
MLKKRISGERKETDQNNPQSDLLCIHNSLLSLSGDRPRRAVAVLVLSKSHAGTVLPGSEAPG